MTATTASRRRSTRPTRSTPPRPVPQILLELAYRLHATKVVGRVSPARAR